MPNDMKNDGQPRAYDSPVRREHAELTRQRISTAAQELFFNRGYARTSIRLIAERAEVSEQTVYAAFGNKQGIVLGIVDNLDLQAGSQQQRALVNAATGDPARQLALMIAFDRRFFERGGDVLMMLRDAGNVEPQLAAGLMAGRERARQMHMKDFEHWQANRHLTEDLSPEEASDIFHAISNIDTFNYLVNTRGWTPVQWQTRTEAILASVLLHTDVEPNESKLDETTQGRPA